MLKSLQAMSVKGISPLSSSSSLTRQQRPHPSQRLSHSAVFKASSVFAFQKGAGAARLGCSGDFTPRFPGDLSHWSLTAFGAFAPDAAGRLRGAGGGMKFVLSFGVAPTLATSLWQTSRKLLNCQGFIYGSRWHAREQDRVRWAGNSTSSPENRARFARFRCVCRFLASCEPGARARILRFIRGLHGRISY